MWQVILTERARRDLRNLDRPVATRIIEAINRYAETSHGDAIPLRGRQAEWRLRVGQWRALFTFDEANERIVVLRVLPRGRAYRR
jgi:mRNA-degrading endonuclease RelE of RelBE toxin-antitoxin system